MQGRRDTDASKLTFPIQLVVLIVATAVTIYTSQAGLRTDQASIRSDLRDIQTRLELGRDIAKTQSAAQDERLAALKAAIDAVSKKQELQALQIAEMSDKLSKLSAGRK